MSVSTTATIWSTTPSQPPGVATLVPKEPGPDKWFEENPVLTVAIAVALVVLLLALIFLCIRKLWKMKKKDVTAKQDGDSEGIEPVEPKPSQGETALTLPEFLFSSDAKRRQSVAIVERPPNVEEGGDESFIIIETPTNTNPRTQARRYKAKRKSLAIAPGFYVSNRRKSVPSISRENELKPPRISFARWSTAGLEIHTTDINELRARANSVSSDSKRDSIPNSSNYVLRVPSNLRRVSQGNNHTIYATEPRKASFTVGNTDN